MLKGWMVVNEYLNTPRFAELSERLMTSSKDEGHNLTKYTNAFLLQHIYIDNEGMINLIGLERPDYIVFWDKDVQLARLLEKLGIPIFNSAESIEICDSKARTTDKLISHSIRMPKTMVCPIRFSDTDCINKEFFERAGDILGLPFIAKESCGSFGEQVYKIETLEDMLRVSRIIKNKSAVLQEYIKSSIGRDLRIYVVGDEPIAAIMRINDMDFRANYITGGRALPYSPSTEFQDMAIRATQAIGLDYAGIDILFGKDDEPIFCEANSNAHFKKIEGITGIDIAGTIMKYIYKKVM